MIKMIILVMKIGRQPDYKKKGKNHRYEKIFKIKKFLMILKIILKINYPKKIKNLTQITLNNHK